MAIKALQGNFLLDKASGASPRQAASGYYFSAMAFNQKPAGGVAINMIAIGSYFLANYIPYDLLEVQGNRVKEMVTFWEYMDTTIRHTSLSIRKMWEVGEPSLFRAGRNSDARGFSPLLRQQSVRPTN